jgi:hypothetical protein
MNLNMICLKIPRLAKWIRCFLVLLAVLMMFGRASGQPVTEPPQRWLLIFDTSVTMERWLPGTATELQNLFYGSMSEELRAGDSVGIWVFNEKLHTDLCLPFTWQPAKAADEASQLKDFLTQQHYLGSTKFSVLGPVLQRVIAGSQRLTIVLFCDGKDDLKLTPYDDSINRAFHAMQADRKKAKDPFILVVRTQLGKFVGATVNLPPGSLDFPTFPPLPASDNPVQTHPPATVLPAEPPPVVTAPPLVIVGTKVVTNADDIKKVTGP